MQHDLDRVLRVVRLVALTPVVADGIGKDGAVSVKGGSGDCAVHGGVAFEAVLCVLIPTKS